MKGDFNDPSQTLESVIEAPQWLVLRKPRNFLKAEALDRRKTYFHKRKMLSKTATLISIKVLVQKYTSKPTTI